MMYQRTDNRFPVPGRSGLLDQDSRQPSAWRTNANQATLPGLRPRRRRHENQLQFDVIKI